MAMHKCFECGKEISTKAENCTNCGAPTKKGRVKQRGKEQGIGCFLIIAGLLLCAILPIIGIPMAIVGAIYLVVKLLTPA